MRDIMPKDTACYCVAARRAANALTKVYDKALAPIQLTVSQYSLLVSVCELAECNKSELAAYSALERTTVIRNLGALRKKGLVEEVRRGDHRGNGIRLTQEGEAVFAEGRVLWKQAQKELRTLLGAENAQELLQALKKVESLCTPLTQSS